jgi:hypothetical protein
MYVGQTPVEKASYASVVRNSSQIVDPPKYIPPELVCEIFRHLNFEEILDCRRVSKTLKRTIDSYIQAVSLKTPPKCLHQIKKKLDKSNPLAQLEFPKLRKLSVKLDHNLSQVHYIFDFLEKLKTPILELEFVCKKDTVKFISENNQLKNLFEKVILNFKNLNSLSTISIRISDQVANLGLFERFLSSVQSLQNVSFEKAVPNLALGMPRKTLIIRDNGQNIGLLLKSDLTKTESLEIQFSVSKSNQRHFLYKLARYKKPKEKIEESNQEIVEPNGKFTELNLIRFVYDNTHTMPFSAVIDFASIPTMRVLHIHNIHQLRGTIEDDNEEIDEEEPTTTNHSSPIVRLAQTNPLLEEIALTSQIQPTLSDIDLKILAEQFPFLRYLSLGTETFPQTSNSALIITNCYSITENGLELLFNAWTEPLETIRIYGTNVDFNNFKPLQMKGTINSTQRKYILEITKKADSSIRGHTLFTEAVRQATLDRIWDPELEKYLLETLSHLFKDLKKVEKKSYPDVPSKQQLKNEVNFLRENGIANFTENQESELLKIAELSESNVNPQVEFIRLIEVATSEGKWSDSLELIIIKYFKSYFKKLYDNKTINQFFEVNAQSLSLDQNKKLAILEAAEQAFYSRPLFIDLIKEKTRAGYWDAKTEDAILVEPILDQFLQIDHTHEVSQLLENDIAPQTKVLSSLKKLHLKRNKKPLSNQTFIQWLPFLSNIQTLEIDVSKDFGREQLRLLARFAPNLTRLRINSSTKLDITNDDLKHLMSSCSSLTFIELPDTKIDYNILDILLAEKQVRFFKAPNWVHGISKKSEVVERFAKENSRLLYLTYTDNLLREDREIIRKLYGPPSLVCASIKYANSWEQISANKMLILEKGIKQEMKDKAAATV